MYTSLVCLALAGVSLSLDQPVWLTDYHVAQGRGQREKKPLAVFFGDGPSGFRTWSQEGDLTRTATAVLARDYVCVYVDVRKQTGRDLAAEFEISKTRGLVISDRTGGYQAFHFDGTLANGQLTRCLERFADPNYVYRGTITNPNQYTSNYPSYADSAFGTPTRSGSVTRSC